jgi:diguanylate cyclase (GGDEF)-like protein
MSAVAAAVILGVLLHQVTGLYRRLWDAHERLIEESRHDFLTSLLTRREGLRRASSLLQQAHRHRFGVSVALLDVDHFKAFNDTHGHVAGDRVLEEVAARVRASLRAGDFAFRFGGEEFGIVFAHASEEEALEAGWRILRAIRTRPVRTQDGPMTVTASIGVAQARPDEGVEQLLERADLGLYEAKRSGRDRVRGHSRLMVVGSDAQGGTPA